jgi:hypothetical protein
MLDILVQKTTVTMEKIPRAKSVLCPRIVDRWPCHMHESVGCSPLAYETPRFLNNTLMPSLNNHLNPTEARAAFAEHVSAG